MGSEMCIRDRCRPYLIEKASGMSGISDILVKHSLIYQLRAVIGGKDAFFQQDAAEKFF